MRPFSILPAGSVAEAHQAMVTHGEQARPYAGGTELLLLMKQKMAHFDYLVDLKTIPGLKGIRMEDGALQVGALTTHRELETSPLALEHLPLLPEVESEVANIRVRSVGTLGGNLCFAEPHSDLGVVAVLLDATISLNGPAGARQVPASAFFLGAYTTSMAPDEILTAITFPLLPPGSAHAYLRFRHHERPSVAVGVVLTPVPGRQTIATARIAVGCAGPVPKRVPTAEAAVVGQSLTGVAERNAATQAAGQAAAAVADAEPDFSGSAEYKTHLVSVYVGRALQAAARRLLGG